MNSIVLRIRTAWSLGAFNIGRALFYRLGLRLGWNKVRKLVAEQPCGPFFKPISCVDATGDVLATGVLGLRLSAFGLPTDYMLGNNVPDWHKNIITGGIAPRLPWWQIPDFVEGLGDIKGVWEASRFDWVLSFAKQTLEGDKSALKRLNGWLQDWCEQNPPYLGANWKCGQESSIRVMHLAMAAHVLEQVSEPAPGLVALVRSHLQRIAPTIQYAIAQDNNHGTSEAAALFIGGSWLVLLSQNSDVEARGWMALGRKWLENRAQRLIEEDGSFSQYSLNYHRVMLDTYSMVELWRRALGLPALSSELRRRLIAATAWLGNMVSPDGKDAPNLGANDGARLLPLAETDYRDVRPSVQLASILFSGARAYAQLGVYDAPLRWLKIQIPSNSVTYIESRQYDCGGYVVMRSGLVMALLRYPRFRFRPSQADALHLDLWLGDENWLRDGGTFSYNTDPQWLEYFPGTAAHNTVQFDGRDQMPRLSRFLFGDWLKTTVLEPLSFSDGMQQCVAGYRDGKGCKHIRRVLMNEKSLSVTDCVTGFKERAVLRWRLKPGDWQVDKATGTLVLDDFVLTVKANAPFLRFELTEGWESRYYLERTPLPVLEVEVGQPAELVSTFEWTNL